MIQQAPALVSAPHRPTPIAAAILCGIVMNAASTAEAATPQGAANPPAITSTVPLNSTDRYVQGKYDKTGTYIPPHYQPVAKPPFHGYFYKKDKAGIDINPNQHQDTDQKQKPY